LPEVVKAPSTLSTDISPEFVPVTLHNATDQLASSFALVYAAYRVKNSSADAQNFLSDFLREAVPPEVHGVVKASLDSEIEKVLEWHCR
jgi:hypothetical protein